MLSDQRSATSKSSVAKLSSVTMAPSIARMKVFSRNCGTYCRMPRRSVRFTTRSRIDGEAGELPEVRSVHRRGTPFREEARAAVERGPVRLNRRTRSQVRAGDVEDLLVR